MKIVRKDADTINIKIELTLEPSDYSGKFKSELKKVQNTAQLKGFRKGKTPEAVIKKMYGKSILLDAINDKLQESLSEYIKEQDFHYIGQPLPDRDENNILDLDINNLKEYTFSFDMGLVPEFEVAGVKNEDTYDIYDVEISDDMVQEEIGSARKRMGSQSDIDDNIELNDIITLEAEELDGGAVKEGGWKTTFTVLVDMIKDEPVKEEILKSKKGDTINFDIYALEDKEASHVKKYLLKLPEDSDLEVGKDFAASITNVSRIVPAEMNEEFFTAFGQEEIMDESSLMEFMKGDLKKFFDSQALQIMYADIRDRMISETQFELPHDFLKKYLKETNEGVNEEVLESEFEPFVKNLRWSLIKSKIASQYDIKIEDQDIRSHFFQRIFQYMRNQGMQDYSFMNSMTDQMMKDEKQVNQAYEEILTNRVFYHIGETVARNPISITAKDFESKVKELNSKMEN